MAKDSLAKASTPEPFSTSKTSNWVARGGGLPDYAQHIAQALVRSGHPESEAIAIAISTIKRWAAGGGNVDAGTKAAAAKALAQWEKLKAANAAKSIGKDAAKARETLFFEGLPLVLVEALYEESDARLSEIEVDADPTGDVDFEEALPWMDLATAVAGPARPLDRVARLWAVLGETWSPQARAAAALARRSGAKKVWMHSQTGHQFFEGDKVHMNGGVGTVVGMHPVKGEARVHVKNAQGHFYVEPDSLRPHQDKAPPSGVEPYANLAHYERARSLLRGRHKIGEAAKHQPRYKNGAYTSTLRGITKRSRGQKDMLDEVGSAGHLGGGEDRPRIAMRENAVQPTDHTLYETCLESQEDTAVGRLKARRLYEAKGGAWGDMAKCPKCDMKGKPGGKCPKGHEIPEAKGKVEEAWSEKARIAALDARHRNLRGRLLKIKPGETYTSLRGVRVEGTAHPSGGTSLHVRDGHFDHAAYHPGDVDPEVGDHATAAAGEALARDDFFGKNPKVYRRHIQTQPRTHMSKTKDYLTESLAESVLSSKERDNLPASDFVFPKTKGYPIADLAHARNALARSSGKPEEAKVKAAVYAKYPQLNEALVEEQEALMESWSEAARVAALKARRSHEGKQSFDGNHLHASGMAWDAPLKPHERESRLSTVVRSMDHGDTLHLPHDVEVHRTSDSLDRPMYHVQRDASKQTPLSQVANWADESTHKDAHSAASAVLSHYVESGHDLPSVNPYQMPLVHRNYTDKETVNFATGNSHNMPGELAGRRSPRAVRA